MLTPCSRLRSTKDISCTNILLAKDKRLQHDMIGLMLTNRTGATVIACDLSVVDQELQSKVRAVARAE
jgi:hypothetical protein